MPEDYDYGMTEFTNKIQKKQEEERKNTRAIQDAMESLKEFNAFEGSGDVIYSYTLGQETMKNVEKCTVDLFGELIDPNYNHNKNKHISPYWDYLC